MNNKHAMIIRKKNISKRFIRYAGINTQSDPSSANCPSTPGQVELARILIEDLLEAGCTEVKLDTKGYVTATLPSNISKSVPVIGLIAHMDTSPDFNGSGVQPRLVENYGGGDIPLDQAVQVLLRPDDFPELNLYKGQDLIVTDGTTLLGADNKAGITEIIEAVRYLQDHPDLKHGEARIGFTPDEEIGRGADLFDIAAFRADFAYTVDGGGIGELEFENFNAAGVLVRINGRNVHPGTAKNKMINALQIAIDFHNMLPEGDRPEKTEGYEGFFHLTRIEGTVENARLDYIIRDHDRQCFEERKMLIREFCARLNTTYKAGTVEAIIKNQYFNMKEKIEPVMHIIDLASRAMRKAGIEPVIAPIRGGTDGAKLSHMGLPTPNIFTGGHNFHGKFEFIPVQSMVKATEVIVNILLLAAGDAIEQS